MATRKAILRAVAGFLALLVLAAALLGAYLDQVATRAVNRWLSAAFPVPASVQKVSIRPFQGRIDVAGLRIANPPGFAHKEFLTLRKGEMEVRLASLRTDEIVAERVRTEGLTVRLERSGRRENAREIFAPVSGKDSKGKDGKRFRIRQLVLSEALVSFPFAGGERVATVDLITIDEPLGKEKGVLLREVIAQVVSRSVRAGAGQGVERAFLGSLSALREGAGKAGQAGKSALDKIKGFFKGNGR